MRIGIVGMGWVGSSVAISTLHAGIARELLLHDIRRELAEGEAMDLAQGSSFYPSAQVRVASLEEMLNTDAVVVAAGRGGGKGASRLSLLAGNAEMIRGLGVAFRGYRGIVVVVSNPVDVLTQLFTEASGLPPARVMGTGTMLDTARLRQVLAQRLDLDPRSIHAHVIGEHGDSEVVLWTSASVGGIPLDQWPEWRPEAKGAIAEEVRRAAYEIIARKGATNHAIGLVTAHLLKWILQGGRRVLTVSRVQEGAAGVEGVALSLPTIVGPEGATRVLEPRLSPQEADALHHSAEILRKARAQVEG